MGSNEKLLLYLTMGDLIQKFRNQADLTISELARRSSIAKGVISKIESGDTKRPALKTIWPISKVLNIPTIEIIEHYVDVEQRPDVLMELLTEAIKLANIPLVTKVALRFLQTHYEDSYILIEQLYNFVCSLKDVTIKLPLYEVIINYARQSGIQQYFAKGMLQKYLIERNDFNNLEKTFYNGEEILRYSDFLSDEEKRLIFYKMTLHAYALKKYKTCIQLCLEGLSPKSNDTEQKARAYLAMINSFSRLGDYDAVEKHLEVFEMFNYDFVAESVKITKAIIKARKKEYNLAIPMLKKCMIELEKDNKIHVVNELLEIYFQTGDMDAFAELIKVESEFIPDKPHTPYKFQSIGRYYRQKGMYQIKTGFLDEGMESYVHSMQTYGMTSAFYESMNDMFSFFLSSYKQLDSKYMDKVKMTYKDVVEKNYK